MTDVYSDSSILLIDSHWLMIQSIYMHRKLSKSSDMGSDSDKRVCRAVKLESRYIRTMLLMSVSGELCLELKRLSV